MENIDAQRALQIIEQTGTNLFLTGKAGTGKTTFLHRLRERSVKRMVVLAPTGIAAINAGGVTMHSFFQLPFGPYVPEATYRKESLKLSRQKIKLIRTLDLVVIDEVSMVRADLLDSMDAVLRRYRNRALPFGGVQLLLIGDLQQLAPVAREGEWNILKPYYDSPFFFSSRALRQTNYVTIELKHVYRQSDPEFLRLLNLVREGSADAAVLDALNRRYVPDFKPGREDGYVRLVTHNHQADYINDCELAAIPETTHRYRACVEGSFPETSYPTEEVLALKLGARIMFLKNDKGKRYYNGMLADIVYIEASGYTVSPLSDPDNLIEVGRETWENTKFVLNEQSGEIGEQVEGTFSQFPVRLAWAITIHKSQGLTFERAVIDAHSAFAHGQTYVALSRCKTLEGLVLSTPIPPAAIIADRSVADYTKEAVRRSPDEATIAGMVRTHWIQTVEQLFDFSEVRFAFDALLRQLEEHFFRLYPATLEQMRLHRKGFREQVDDVAVRFHQQLSRLTAASQSLSADTHLQSRLRKGAEYFGDRLTPLYAYSLSCSLPSDNKQLKRRTQELVAEFSDALRIKLRLLNLCREEGFDLKTYMGERALAALDENRPATTTKAKQVTQKSSVSVRERIMVPSEVLHPELYQQLVAWRYDKSRQLEVPAFHILTQKALLGIVNLLPDTPEHLQLVPYFGKKGVEKFGGEILEIVCSYMERENLERPEVQTVRVERRKGEKTYDLSLNLFKEGKSVEEIAHERQLTVSTIYNHLVRQMLADRLPLSALISSEDQARVEQYLDTHEGQLPNYGDFESVFGKKILYKQAEAVMKFRNK